MIKWGGRILIAVMAILGIVALSGLHEARSMPVVHRATIRLPHWPAGRKPVTVALIADIHMASATMDEARLARVVDRIAALHPDLAIYAGDFIEGRGEAEAAAALPILARQLGRLRPPLGSVAVLGNHDHWTDPKAVAATLAKAGITVLVNNAVERGPLALGGADDPATDHADIGRTAAAMRRRPGARVMIAHSPDIAPKLPADVSLLLAGHTHCGQVVLPLIGPPIDVANARYRCGMIRDSGHLTIVTGGLGTSDVPIRIGAPPDIWLIRLEG
jgi:predicted MPP superfamily phosphohydrolase